MRLRARQVEFVDRCVDALEANGNTLGVAPTGFGKSVALSAVAGRYTNAGANAVIVQHRDELVEQNIEKFRLVNPRSSVGMFNADMKDFGGQATFAMAQTLSRQANLDRMPPVDLMVIDEGHHAAADGYLRMVDHGRKLNPNMRLFLVTATPNRGDKRSLRGIVDNVADVVTLKELIEARLLVRPRSFVIDLGVQNELRGVKKRADEFDMSVVEGILDKEVLRDRVVEEWAKVAADRQTVAFCSTVTHATHVAETFRSNGIRAACVWGDMPDVERKSTLAAYERGDIQVLTNVAVLTEGWDAPITSCVILLRPASYLCTVIQMVGRGLRILDPEKHPGVSKDDCVVLDFGTSLLMHGGLEQQVNIDQAGVKDCPECAVKVPAQVPECPICGYIWPKPEAEATVRMIGGDEGDGDEKPAVLTEFVMTEIELLADSPFRYENIFGGLVSIATALDAWVAVISYHHRWHAVGGAKMLGVKHLADSDDRFVAMAAADDFLRIHGDDETAHKTKRWMSQPCSDKQRDLLGLEPMAAIGVTKYVAACRIEWKFNEKAIRGLLERASGGMRRAA
jgi:DNA repair protein RadD